MLAKRVIPCLDLKNGRVVKGTRFVNLVDAGDPVAVARHYDREGADELVMLDITATAERRPIMLEVVRRTAECVFLPLTVGGGVRDTEDFRVLLNAGADKVSVNSAAVLRPALISEAARRFGRQCVVVAIDARRRSAGPFSRGAASRTTTVVPAKMVLRDQNRRTSASRGAEPDQAGTQALRDQGPHEVGWEVVIAGGRTPTGRDVIAWARETVRLGAGELLLTSMDCDGANQGYDLELCRAVSDAVEVPVIASGGAGHPRHMVQALGEGHADAVLAAGIFHRREFSLAEVKDALRQAGLPVRLSNDERKMTNDE